MKIEILISTMNLLGKNENTKLIKKMNATTNTLTINQITKENIGCSQNLIGKNRLISIKEKGLSKSRNRAIKNAKAEICILADDDVKYEKNFEEIIEKAYEKYSNYDILCFYVESKGNRKVKKMITGRVGKLRTMRICSFQITFKKDAILQKNIKFNENFGAGTYYDRGEETIFLWECIKNGLKIKFVNKKIAEVDQMESTWFKGFTKDFFEKQGVVFYNLSNKFYKVLIFQYAIRKYKLYDKNFNLINVIKYMNNGIDKYKNKEYN